MPITQFPHTVTSSREGGGRGESLGYSLAAFPGSLPLPHMRLRLGVARSLCLGDGGRPNERVDIVGIGWVLLASATSGFSGYIKLAYCSSAKGLQ